MFANVRAVLCFYSIENFIKIFQESCLVLTKGWTYKNVYLPSNAQITLLRPKVKNFISEMTNFSKGKGSFPSLVSVYWAGAILIRVKQSKIQAKTIF